MENFWKMLGVKGTLFVYMAVGAILADVELRGVFERDALLVSGVRLLLLLMPLLA